MIKVYAIAGILVAAVAYVAYSQWRISDLEDGYAKEKTAREQFESSLNQERKSRQLENFARGQYLAELEKAEDEKKRLEKCIAGKSCVRTIRVRVPSGYVPSTGGSGGDEEVAAQLSPSSARIIADLEYRIKQWEAWAAMCQKTVFNWANPSKSP